MKYKISENILVEFLEDDEEVIIYHKKYEEKIRIDYMYKILRNCSPNQLYWNGIEIQLVYFILTNLLPFHKEHKQNNKVDEGIKCWNEIVKNKENSINKILNEEINKKRA